MAARKKKRGLRPRIPSRVKRRKPAKPKRSRAHGHHSELWGLGLVALGLFLAVVLYGGWNGGIVGGPAADAVHGLVGAAAYVVPLALLGVGGLMVARSELVDFRPFRLGLIVFVFGLLDDARLRARRLPRRRLRRRAAEAPRPGRRDRRRRSRSSSGRCSSPARRSARSSAARTRRCGARRSEGRVRRPCARARRRSRRSRPRRKPPLDAVEAYPDVVGGDPQPLLVQPPEHLDEDPPTLFDVKDLGENRPEYVLPDRSLLHRSQSTGKADPTAADRIGEALVQTLEHFGIDATLVGRIAGPRVTRYELQLAPGTKVSKVAALKDDLSYALATTEIRILAPIPGKQAVGVEVPNLTPEPRHARRHLRRPAADGVTALRLARQGHLRQRGVDRPRADAAHPHRRHDRLGQVRLHQHDPHVDPPARDARTRCG